MAKRSLIGAAVLIVGAGALAWWLHAGRDLLLASSAAPPALPPPVPVVEGVAGQRSMPVYVQGIGTVQAFNAVTVKSRVDGQIMQVSFAEGQEVKQGDSLFQIDPRPFEAALEQAMAGKQRDEAQLVSAEADLARYSKLVNSGYQTRQSYDTQKAQVAQLQASIKGDQAQIDNARLNLGYTDLHAPIGGRTGARLVDKGNLIHAGDNTPLVTITQIKPIFVSFTVPQDRLSEIRRNQAAGALEVEALDSSSASHVLADGKLSLIDNQVDAATGTIHLKATFANDDEALWPGQFVNARLVLAVRNNAITVPATTVQQGPEGYFAFAIKPDQTVERRAVDVLGFQDGMAIVANGLAIGEKVVVDGQYRLTAGMRIRAVPSAQPAGSQQQPEAPARPTGS
ncbi:MAG: rane fusion protein multidrug efflux system [Rhodospirillaceae bacterium]|nr:rane fusion protein multidrug efflux system [Rhodospirillaceae bacterium]